MLNNGTAKLEDFATPLHFCDDQRKLQIPGFVSQGVMQQGFQGKWIDHAGVDFREAS